jgi:hypothetical protein
MELRSKLRQVLRFLRTERSPGGSSSCGSRYYRLSTGSIRFHGPVLRRHARRCDIVTSPNSSDRPHPMVERARFGTKRRRASHYSFSCWRRRVGYGLICRSAELGLNLVPGFFLLRVRVVVCPKSRSGGNPAHSPTTKLVELRSFYSGANITQW